MKNFQQKCFFKKLFPFLLYHQQIPQPSTSKITTDEVSATVSSEAHCQSARIHQSHLVHQRHYRPTRKWCEQQLDRDRDLAVEPDTKTPFKYLMDAMRRLVRYHTLQDHKPEEGSSETRSCKLLIMKSCSVFHSHSFNTLLPHRT